MTRKLIMFDIDGTILDHESKVPASTKEAIQLLKENGHEVAIATGRSPYFISELRALLEIDSFVCFNGQYVEIDNEVIYKNPTSKEYLKELFDFSSEKEHPLVYMSAEKMKSTVEMNHVMEGSFASINIDTSHIHVNSSYFNEIEIYQTLLFCQEHEEAAYRKSMKDLNFIRWHQNSVDVLPMGGSKAMGIERFMEHTGFSKENVYAFGDNFNDVEMLQFVGHGVAMGNAPEQVKQVARYVTKDVGDDGIAHGLEMVGLL
ncbi:Cof-type HAD-IIB family hydrolase [Sporosarcina pasteurii]|uniref:Bifunctional phosphatase/peptidyl-prolyl cis-trans isomerase n=1 Tax=Sporosarcina pasteurii TaxID=1474 RepID=A0A380BES8_SPOPA|nr:Cof-type HAD-IIB family hydrolase [Sporosarcina pasteurii]MDS9472441.1 Cof-type HAD-IIB family hydrolase [Sporosarcina pasteurii]QBQ05999.1 Cof-type HAD-IIB family hydrolase [Sporosarcina pasteurii]SUI99703.1 Putative bifunctional phosphatase/peptidyl-prolyl cis-trans isomerase [Sporosarcina pasteurii]